MDSNPYPANANFCLLWPLTVSLSLSISFCLSVSLSVPPSLILKMTSLNRDPCEATM